MSGTAVNGSPRSARPPLPYSHANPFLTLTEQARSAGVKFQVITRDGQEIIVGRVKIATPHGGHAFVLRRFDTGAISQTTMFRAAFPGASDEVEKVESLYVKSNFDSVGANGGAGKDVLRLAGVWVNPEVATMLAPMYALENAIKNLIVANPDPTTEYRRSSKPATPGAKEASSPAKATTSTATSSATPGAPPSPVEAPKPAKRRKEASPSPKKEAEDTQTLRRSSRVLSPPPQEQFVARTTRTKVIRTSVTKASTKSKDEKPSGMLTPADEEEEEAADVPGPDMQQDINDQKELIAKLKADRAAQEVSAVPVKESDSKRSHEDTEDQQLTFQFREPDEIAAVAKREVKSNKRLQLDLEPEQKSAAWGALWFATGLTLAATIPAFLL